jgi:hypothetical protein
MTLILNKAIASAEEATNGGFADSLVYIPVTLERSLIGLGSALHVNIQMIC